LGIGDWGLGPIPNPQSPIPNLVIVIEEKIILNLIYKYYNKQNNINNIKIYNKQKYKCNFI